MRYAVDVTTSAVAPGRFESTCSCSCGWRLTTTASSSQMATRVSDRARGNHFADAHPDQRSNAAPLTVALEPGHAPALSGASRDGFLWERSIVCACDWETTVTGRTPLEAASSARFQHRRHVRRATSPSAHNDYFVLLGVAAIVAVLIAALVAVAINTSLI